MGASAPEPGSFESVTHVAPKKSTEDLLGPFAVVGGEGGYADLGAELADLVLQLADARPQLVDLVVPGLGALTHLEDAHHAGQVDALDRKSVV